MAQQSPPTLVIRPKPGDSPRPKKLNLEHLPLEVVLQIYERTLVECPRWDKTHKAICRYKPTFGSDVYENPPFLQSRVTVSSVYDGMGLKTFCPCDCAKRKGLGLLLASKGVHEAAAPVFWGKNTFCFLDGVEFVSAVGRSLRSEYREMIRHISIMNPDKNGYPMHVSFMASKAAQRHALWDTIDQCKKLESLDIPAPYLTPNRRFSVQRLSRLVKNVPTLSVLKLNFLLPFSSMEMWDEYPSPWYDHSLPKVTFARCSRTIAFREQEWTTEIVQDMLRNLQYNYRVYVNTAIKTTYLGATLDELEKYQDTFQLTPGIDEYSNKRQVTLPTSETTTVRFYGLPLGKRHRMDRFREKQALDKKQKKANKLTHSQNEAVTKAKQTKKQKREREAFGNRAVHNRELLERGERLVDLKAEEDKSARRQQRKIGRMVKRNTEAQRCERKRVPRLVSGKVTC